jgi:hypothetical protein
VVEMQSLKILAVIPAREQSKGVPNMNIIKVFGKPHESSVNIDSTNDLLIAEHYLNNRLKYFI